MKPTEEASIIQTLDQLQREGKAPMPPLLEARQTVALFKCMLALGWDDVHLDVERKELRRG